jgi:protein-tyrosine phosphatase
VFRICFVCLGNICRSPTAEGVFLRKVSDAGLAERVHIDSAGTASWHTGKEADARSRAVASARGYTLPSRARQFERADFARFDLILAMDRNNRDDLLELAPDPAARAKVRLLRSFDRESVVDAEVPDPYYGGDDGFEDVLDICERASAGLLAHVLTHLN